MNNNAKKWVKALRSGDYAKTTGGLQDSEGYCCLGVACVVYEEETGDKLQKYKNGCFKGFNLAGSASRVRRWLGLRTPDGSCSDMELTYYNDGELLSFQAIADIIESEPKGLFNE